MTLIELTLLLVGLGKGSTMMPATSAALSTVKRHEIARAMSGLNVVQRAGGAIGTAPLAVVLANRTTHLVPAGSGAPPDGLGLAFGQTFLWSLGAVGLAIITAIFLLGSKTRVRAREIAAEVAPQDQSPA
jgi:hypothetical protein